MDVTSFTNVPPALFWMTLFLVLSLLCTIVMMVVLLIRGDERKHLILSKTALVSVVGGIVVLTAGFVYGTWIQPHMTFEIELHPILYLGAIAIIFDVAYLHYHRKYGA